MIFPVVCRDSKAAWAFSCCRSKGGTCPEAPPKGPGAADPQGIQGTFKGILADAVIDDVDSTAAGQRPDASRYFAVIEDVVGTGLAGLFRLFRRRGRGDDNSAAPLQHLDQQQAHSPGHLVRNAIRDPAASTPGTKG